MTPEVKGKFISALRSGQYQQGFGRLRDNHDRFCALGVLCDVVDPDGWKQGVLNWDWHESGGHLLLGSDREALFGNPYDMYTQSTILGMNDTKKMTFQEIADWIERNL